MSSPSPEANSNDAITVLSDTPIAEALRKVREEAGLSVSMMARCAQNSRAAIHAYETGARNRMSPLPSGSSRHADTRWESSRTDDSPPRPRPAARPAPDS